ncbi:class I SAM-dependent methyltransferase [Kordiimonas sp. SCSIO 12610]|uniref:class I SAM-dependent methyltransferase n=1 Tax=Kordiimonas sp. SCSIO 12610 TaxID=2829597 RepID=UPI00210AD7F5|nr:methyltransferase domain-containing protein [Kordiimonas sp. SCSIO 12610]UTW56707.1 class I SAM-dependent methyltransferase [Kordiimonas sp. SCSIO 12610]
MKNSMKIVGVTALLLNVVASPALLADGHGVIKDAIASIDRPEIDRKDDAARKPGAVLAFAELKEGMTALDINAGGGYYTEILSRVVGDNGKVYSHNGPVYWSFINNNADVNARYADKRLPNVERIQGSEQVDITANSVDVAISVLAYHDYYFVHKARLSEKEDVPAALKSIYNALKPGGVFVIVDHVAPAGSGESAGDTLHRIDPKLVEKQMVAVGFKLEKTSDILANPDDPHTISPFDDSIRRKTDRFVHLYRKPA